MENCIISETRGKEHQRQTNKCKSVMFDQGIGCDVKRKTKKKMRERDRGRERDVYMSSNEGMNG